MRTSTVVFALLLAPVAAADESMQVTRSPQPRHAVPRFKASYRLFSIGNLDGSRLWLNGAQIDAYALSRRWIRLGLELEGGAGRTDLAGSGLGMAYGLLGFTGGVQYPARVTPFVDGRAVGGILHGELEGSLAALGLKINGGSATTYLYGGGIETGIEVYAYRQLYVTGAIGWVHTTWRGPDAAAMLADPRGGLKTKDLVGDAFTCKLGFGI
jgi:hypothetical protein